MSAADAKYFLEVRNLSYTLHPKLLNLTPGSDVESGLAVATFPPNVEQEVESIYSRIYAGDISIDQALDMLRQSRAWGRMATRRFESTTTAKATETAKEAATKVKDTASKAKETASEVKDSATAKASATVSEYSTKAAEGLSKVTSSAGPAIAGAAKGVANSLGKAGGRTGKLVAFIEST